MLGDRGTDLLPVAAAAAVVLVLVVVVLIASVHIPNIWRSETTGEPELFVVHGRTMRRRRGNRCDGWRSL